MISKILVSASVVALVSGFIYRDTLIRVYQGYCDTQQAKSRAKYYELPGEAQIVDITQKLIADDSIPDDLKQPLIRGERHIIVFKYRSDDNFVAGYFSYLTSGEHPVMIFLRGGNGYYGVMRPNNRFSYLAGYNVVGTLYRGNIYGGSDEFGGADINDVENCLKFFPKLEAFTNVKMPRPYTMMGVSRGAMQMFGALSRSDFVKENVDKAISISGNVDLNVSMKNRPAEMGALFKMKYKDSNEKSFADWIKFRNPTDNVTKLSKSLKILLIYGSADNRVSLAEQQAFKKSLDENGLQAKLVTIEGGDHGIENRCEKLAEVLSTN